MAKPPTRPLSKARVRVNADAARQRVRPALPVTKPTTNNPTPPPAAKPRSWDRQPEAPQEKTIGVAFFLENGGTPLRVKANVASVSPKPHWMRLPYSLIPAVGDELLGEDRVLVVARRRWSFGVTGPNALAITLRNK